MKTLYIPLMGQPMCGHSGPFMLCGREQSSFRHEIGDTEYIGMMEQGDCRPCNEETRKRMVAKAEEMHDLVE